MHLTNLFDINSTLFYLSNPNIKLSPDTTSSPTGSRESINSENDDEKLFDKKPPISNKFSIENLIKKD